MDRVGEKPYELNHPIKVLESRLLQYSGVHIILEMSVVEWQTYAVEAQASKELGIILHEEVLQKLFEEEFLLLFSQNLQHCCSVLVLVAWIAGAIGRLAPLLDAGRH